MKTKNALGRAFAMINTLLESDLDENLQPIADATVALINAYKALVC